MYEVITFWQQSPFLFACLMFSLGCCIGSFINVVAYRLPMMLQRNWQNQCRQLLDIASSPKAQPFNLCLPRSHCPHCQQPIRAWHNIPLISYCWLKGRCAVCQTTIALRYPVIELATGLITLLVCHHFAWSWQTLWVLVLSYGLLAEILIDAEHQILPDEITLPLLWLGLLLNISPVALTDSASAIIGATAGYLSLWLIAKSYYLMTRREGMGHGDFKLLALWGAWMGWQALPLIILLSSLLGAIVGITAVFWKGRDYRAPMPFGPYLGFAGWITLIWNKPLLGYYWQLVSGS